MPSSIMTISQVIMEIISNGPISGNFAPAVQLHFNGHLVALLSASGVVLYSTSRGDQILGSYFSTRGYETENIFWTPKTMSKR